MQYDHITSYMIAREYYPHEGREDSIHAEAYGGLSVFDNRIICNIVLILLVKCTHTQSSNCEVGLSVD